MHLNGKVVLLAGATGLAGSSIMRHILARHPTTRIRAVYHKNTRPFIKHRRVTYVYADLVSKRDLGGMVRGCGCAIMAAAYTGGAGFVASHQWEHMRDNLIMNMRMMEAFRESDIERIVYVGSATVYQEYEGSIKEDGLDLNKDPDRAYRLFGWTVRFIEQLCRHLRERSGKEVLVARASNIYGPYDRFDPAASHFIPAIIRKAADRMDPFEVWGRPDVARDVIYAKDFARAIALLADKDTAGHTVFNIGSGSTITVKDVVRLALRYARHDPSEIRYDRGGPLSAKTRSIDCTRANTVLGWRPVYSAEEGIRKTTEWWIKNRRRWKK